jgi:4-amino-4-deoxy-L-arabinose transferase-like glycosyltransferase
MRDAPTENRSTRVDRTGSSALRRVRNAAPPAAVLVASGLLFVVCLMWAVMTPGTRAPDELQHLNSIVRLADGGGWPEPGDARVLTGVLETRDLAGATVDGQRTFLPGSVNAQPGAPMFADLEPPLGNDRTSLAQLDDGSLSRGVDQMTQHPPGYYLASALAYKLVGAENWRFDRAIFFLRALTALTIAVSVPVCCYVATREITGRENAGRVAAFLPLFIPQLGFIGGAITNDGLAIAVAAVLTAALVKIMSSGPTFGRLALVAVSVGVGCLTKGTVLPLMAAVPLALFVAHFRRRASGRRGWWLRAIRDTVLTLGAAFVLGGWWWALNLVRYGTLQPAGMSTPTLDRPALSASQFADIFQQRISASYFGDFGLLEAPMPLSFTRTMTYLFLALAAVALVSRHKIGERVMFLLMFGLTIGVLFMNTYGSHLLNHNLGGLQGRYLFVVLVPTLSLVAIGLYRIARLVRLPSVLLVLGTLVVGLGISAAGLLYGFRTYYLPAGQSLGTAVDRLIGWSAWSWPVMAMVPVLGVALLLLLAFSLGRGEGRADELSDGPEDGPDDWDDDRYDEGDRYDGRAADGWLDLDDRDGGTQPQRAVRPGRRAEGATAY